MKKLYNITILVLTIILLFLFTDINSQTTGFPTLQWASAAGGADPDQSRAIAVDPQGNTIITGFFWYTCDFDPGPGVYNLTATSIGDMFVLKLDPSGNFAWAFNLGNTGIESGQAVSTDALGNIYVAGYFVGAFDFDPGPGVYTLNGSGSSDIFVMKLDPSGNFTWAKKMGGTGIDDVFSMKLDASNNIHIAGHFANTCNFDPTGTYTLTSAGGQDAYVCKLDPSGNLLWARAVGGPLDDHCQGINIDAAGNVYASGSFSVSADLDPGPGTYSVNGGSNEAFILKLDASGNFVWAKRFGNANSEEPYAITIDHLNNIYAIGNFYQTIDFDPGPGIYNLTSNGATDFYILKLDASGNFIWAKTIGGPGYENGFTIFADSTGIYCGGSIGNTVDFDPGPGSYIINPASGGYSMKFDLSGNFLWAVEYSYYVYSIVVDNAGFIYSSGVFNGVSDLDPGPAVYNFTAAGSNDIFVHKMKQNAISTNIKDMKSENVARCYPNPFNTTITIESEKNTDVKIYDAKGELIYETKTNDVITKINMSQYASGIYFVHANNSIQKIIKN